MSTSDITKFNFLDDYEKIMNFDDCKFSKDGLKNSLDSLILGFLSGKERPQILLEKNLENEISFEFENINNIKKKKIDFSFVLNSLNAPRALIEKDLKNPKNIILKKSIEHFEKSEKIFDLSQDYRIENNFFSEIMSIKIEKNDFIGLLKDAKIFENLIKKIKAHKKEKFTLNFFFDGFIKNFFEDEENYQSSDGSFKFDKFYKKMQSCGLSRIFFKSKFFPVFDIFDIEKEEFKNLYLEYAKTVNNDDSSKLSQVEFHMALELFYFDQLEKNQTEKENIDALKADATNGFEKIKTFQSSLKSDEDKLEALDEVFKNEFIKNICLIQKICKYFLIVQNFKNAIKPEDIISSVTRISQTLKQGNKNELLKNCTQSDLENLTKNLGDFCVSFSKDQEFLTSCSDDEKKKFFSIYNEIAKIYNEIAKEVMPLEKKANTKNLAISGVCTACFASLVIGSFALEKNDSISQKTALAGKIVFGVLCALSVCSIFVFAVNLIFPKNSTIELVDVKPTSPEIKIT